MQAQEGHSTVAGSDRNPLAASIRRIQEKGFFLSPEALKILLESPQPDKLVEVALENAAGAVGKFFIEPPDFHVKEKTKITAPPTDAVVVRRTEFKPYAKEIEARVKLSDNGGSDFSTGTIEDFAAYFKDRYKKIRSFFAERVAGITEIADLSKKRGERVKIVALISDKKVTKNGHLLFFLEDLSGSANALVPASSKQLFERAGVIVRDEVLAFEGRLSKDLFIIDDFFFPDLPIPTRPPRQADEDVAIALMSDFHIGSRLFMKRNFENFLAWLRGERGDKKDAELAGKIKYVVIAGDNVDGLGIYPNQENELELLDIYEQYAALTQYLKQIPEYIQIIVAPGNHDAVKHADPQPKLPQELVPELYGMKNVTLVGNPALVELHGLKTLIYHGYSFDDLIPAVPGLNYEETDKVMLETLRCRHLHPIYGGKPITPTLQDSLVITEPPDLFHTGHLHKNGYERYRNTTCINAGTWQQVTQFQIKQGHKPTPCILPVLEAKTGRINVVRFDIGVT